MFGITPYTRRNNTELSGYNPFRMFDDFEKNFWNSNELAEFKTDIKDNGNEYVMEADLPGFKKENIKIDIDNDTLTITAERKNENSEKDDKGNYIRMERSYGSFSRSFDVSGINTEEISASYNDGVLTLNMPKKTAKQERARHLEIK